MRLEYLKPVNLSWRQRAKIAIQEYPRLKLLHDDLHSMQITPSYAGQTGHGSGEQRTTEDVAITELDESDQAAYDAVSSVVESWKGYARKVGSKLEPRRYIGVVEKHFWSETSDDTIMVMAQLSKEDMEYILDCFVSDVAGRLNDDRR